MRREPGWSGQAAGPPCYDLWAPRHCNSAEVSGARGSERQGASRGREDDRTRGALYLSAARTLNIEATWRCEGCGLVGSPVCKATFSPRGSGWVFPYASLLLEGGLMPLPLAELSH